MRTATLCCSQYLEKGAKESRMWITIKSNGEPHVKLSARSSWVDWNGEPQGIKISPTSVHHRDGNPSSYHSEFKSLLVSERYGLGKIGSHC